MASDGSVDITWVGHATTRIDFDGKTVLIDPWLQGNPAAPDSMKQIDRLDLMLITHGHSDHMADAVSVAQQTQPDIICNVEIGMYLGSKGIGKTTGMNKGGTVSWNGLQVTMVDAVHSSGITDGDRVVDGGTAAGFVLRFPNGFTLYHAGDTDLFESMRLIGRRYSPDVAMLPIGGHFTMDPSGAAEALELLDITSVIPIHYGTFPLLAGTPDQLRDAANHIGGIKVIALKPGETANQKDLV